MKNIRKEAGEENKFLNITEKPHNGIISLGKPYIKHNENCSRLCAMLSMDNEQKEVYFEVDREWEKYLTFEVSDPFIYGIIELAMKKGYDIEFEQPMSEDVYYVLTTYMIPVYARNFKKFNEIDLIGDTTSEEIPSEKRTGTGFSAGVDSFYSVLKHFNNKKCPNLNITHLLLALNGAASSGMNEEFDKKWLDESRSKLQPCADKMGLKLVCVGGNLDLLYIDNRCMQGDTVMTASFVYALQKLFSTYYWASAYPAEIFGFDIEEKMTDGGFHENISVQYVSSKAIRFYHSGSETNRIGKVSFIADEPLVQEYLTVCGESDAKNCGCCFKCLRTMAELNAIGKLDLFKKSFPVDDYKKNYSRKLAMEFATDHAPFTTDIKFYMKKNKIKIPLSVYPKTYLFYKPLEAIRKKLRNNRHARELYYKLNLDEKYGGRHQPDEERALKLSGHGK